MARKQILTVRPRQPLKRNKLYRVRVLQIRVGRRSSTLTVLLEHTQGHQKGRRHEYCFDLPLYPQSPASQFFTACGLDVGDAGSRVCVDDVINATVNMEFSAPDCDQTAVTFARITQPSHPVGQCSEAERRPIIDQYDETFEGKDPL